MPLQLTGQTGPQTAGDGVSIPFRQGKNGELVVQELHGRYYEQAYRGAIFTASNAASTSSAGLATTYTGGVCVSNPAGSTKNLVILKASVAFSVVSAAVTTAGLISGWSQAGVVTHTTPLTPFSNLIGSQVPAVAKADQACTLVGTPAWLVAGFGATPQAVGAFAVLLDLEGDVVVGPGGYVATGTSIASTALSILASITWEEVPI